MYMYRISFSCSGLQLNLVDTLHSYRYRHARTQTNTHLYTRSLFCATLDHIHSYIYIKQAYARIHTPHLFKACLFSSLYFWAASPVYPCTLVLSLGEVSHRWRTHCSGLLAGTIQSAALSGHLETTSAASAQSCLISRWNPGITGDLLNHNLKYKIVVLLAKWPILTHKYWKIRLNFVFSYPRHWTEYVRSETLNGFFLQEKTLQDFRTVKWPSNHKKCWKFTVNIARESITWYFMTFFTIANYCDLKLSIMYVLDCI